MMRTHLAIRESGLFQLPSMGTLKAKVSVAQSCLTLCDPMDCSSPGSSVHGILHGALCVGTWQKLELLLRLLQGFKQPDGLISIHMLIVSLLLEYGSVRIMFLAQNNMNESQNQWLSTKKTDSDMYPQRSGSTWTYRQTIEQKVKG